MLSVTTTQRDELLTIYRYDSDPDLRFHAHILLRLAEGHPWDTIEFMLLLDRVFTWLGQANPFQIEGSAYPKAKAV
ncbi:hypothetical protein V5E97_30175 [Singulisphaera sp. Ch08]|uniref:Uncharacterized protein n=1 Tax=Singulisphaera sp. Ch08 TaxID=3120278 RepID=A0AAU7CBM3_9BACT